MRPTWTIVESGHRWLDLCRSLIVIEQEEATRRNAPHNVLPRLQSLELGQAIAWHQEPRGGLLLLDGSSLTVSEISGAVFRCRCRDPRAFFIASIPALQSPNARPEAAVWPQLLQLGVNWCVSGPEAFLRDARSLLRASQEEQTDL